MLTCYTSYTCFFFNLAFIHVLFWCLAFLNSLQFSSGHITSSSEYSEIFRSVQKTVACFQVTICFGCPVQNICWVWGFDSLEVPGIPLWKSDVLDGTFKIIGCFSEKKSGHSAPGIYLITLMSTTQEKHQHCLKSLFLQTADTKEDHNY